MEDITTFFDALSGRVATPSPATLISIQTLRRPRRRSQLRFPRISGTRKRYTSRMHEETIETKKYEDGDEEESDEAPPKELRREENIQAAVIEAKVENRYMAYTGDVNPRKESSQVIPALRGL